MLKNIFDAYKAAGSDALNPNIDNVDTHIQQLVFNNKLLLKVSYNKGKSLLLSLRCNIKFVYYLDMILKLLNVVEHDDDNDTVSYDFIINGKYVLNNNYSILTNLNVNNIFLGEEVNEAKIPLIDIQKSTEHNKSNSIVTIDRYDTKNKYRLDFFESLRQSSFIMFKHSRNVLKLNVKDGNNLWESFFVTGNFSDFNKVISKYKLINLKENIPVRVVFKSGENKLTLRQPLVEPGDTLEEVIDNKLGIKDYTLLCIQGFIIQNYEFQISNLYQNFYSPDGFLYIVLVI